MATDTQHTNATNELRRWDAPDDQQQSLRTRYLNHLHTHPDALRKSGPPVHLTASAIIITTDAQHVLLTLHAKAKLWLQTGGHLEPHDTSLAAGALREAREESGLNHLTVHNNTILRLDAHDLNTNFGRCRTHLDVQFAVTTPHPTPPTCTEESLDIRWFDANQLPEQTDDAVRRLVAAAQHHLTH